MTNISAKELLLMRWAGPRDARDNHYQGLARTAEFNERPYLFVRINTLYESIQRWSAGGTQPVAFNCRLDSQGLQLTVKVERKLWKGRPAGKIYFSTYELV